MKVRSRFDRGERVQLVCEGDGRTRQSSRDECDINMIMAKYQRTGAVDHLSKHGARYDFCDGLTFHDAMNTVKDAESMFADLPSSLRTRFVEPGDFLDFVQDEANVDEMVVLGIASRVAAQVAPEARTGEQPPAGELPTEVVSPSAEAAEVASE